MTLNSEAIITSLTHSSNWLQRTYDHEELKRISDEADIPLPIAAILAQRGYTDTERIKDFLQPQLSLLPSPFGMKDMQKAVEILYDAVTQEIPIVVYGDYDVDGATGTAVVILFLQQLGVKKLARCQPQRLRDGYGLHKDVVMNALGSVAERPGLLITVDCGISDIEQIAQLKRLGFTVVVTDHHQPPAGLPEADAILNPHQECCSFPCKYLAGVGVAFYYMMGFRAFLREKGFFGAGENYNIPNLRNYLDLVALGTIADMVPLCDANRILVKAGLDVMSQRQRPCFKALAEHIGNFSLQVLSDEITFRFAPLLNASSRIDDTSDALTFLLTEQIEQARAILKKLDDKNKIRRDITQEILNDAQAKATELVENGHNSIVLFSENWHQGVIGIVASQLVNIFQKPVIIFSVAGGLAKGSGRSVPGVDMYEKISECRALFKMFGGHKSAVGLTMPVENMKKFQVEFESMISEAILLPDKNTDKNGVDWISPTGEIFAENFLKYYELLEPFGVGNPEPVFASEGMITSVKIVGGSHVKFVLKKNDTYVDGIGFNIGHKVHEIDTRDRCEIIFRFNKNTFKGKRTWQMNTIDIRNTR